MEIYRNIDQLDVYKQIVEHRKYCPKWRLGVICLDCFGGGITRFTDDLLREMKSKCIKIEDLI